MKPYSAACDNNRFPILEIITPLFCQCKNVLEIGSGTGQHAVYFAESLGQLIWHTSDKPENHAGIIEWLEESGLSNIEKPLLLDVSDTHWPKVKFDAVYTANTCHIMSWNEVVAMFSGVQSVLLHTGLFVVYGPFNYAGKYTSESNARFDNMLKQRDTDSGIRNFEALNELAGDLQLDLIADNEMPANNRLLVFEKIK